MVPVIGPARDFGEDMERALIAIEHDRIGDAWSFGLLSFASGPETTPKSGHRATPQKRP
jgi:hypothetical protein